MKTFLVSAKWPLLFRKVELFIKAIICPRGKNFWCDSKCWQVCYCCGAVRYMMRTQSVFNPKNYIWKVWTKEFCYIVTRDFVSQKRVSDMLKHPCPERSV